MSETQGTPSGNDEAVVAANRAHLTAICSVAVLTYAMYFGAFGVMLPHIGDTFGLGAEAQGRLFPANFAGFGVGVLLSGYLSDRIGRKSVMLIASVLFTAGLILFGSSHQFEQALAASALIGAGSGSLETVASALLSDLYPEKRALALNALQIVFGVGAASSPYFLHLALERGLAWQTFFFGFGGVMALQTLWLAFVKYGKIVVTHGEGLDTGALKRVVREPAFIALCLMQLFYVGAETGFFTWMPTYFEKILIGGKPFAGLVVSVFWVTITLGRLLTGVLIGKIPLMQLTLVFGIGGAIGGLLAISTLQPVFVLLAVGFTGFCFSGIFGLVLAEAGDRFPKSAGTVFGAIVASCGVGGALSPWVIGSLSETSVHWRGALALVPACSLIVAALSLGVSRMRKKQD